MKTFYTVDRLGALSTGQNLSLFSNRLTDVSFRSFLDELFPSGISKHGQQYLENAACKFYSKEGALELYFEEVRKACYPNAPSRFESIFCCESLQDAKDMACFLESPSSPVFEIHAGEDFLRVNMALLNNTGSILSVAYRAHDYWRGKEGEIDQKPIWEIIAKLPVTVGRKVG